MLVNCDREIKELSLPQFLETDMNRQVLLVIKFFPLSPDHVIRTFKIMPRSCNAHAYINAGFCAKISRQDAAVQIVGKPTFIYGGIRSSLVSNGFFFQLLICSVPSNVTFNEPRYTLARQKNSWQINL